MGKARKKAMIVVATIKWIVGHGSLMNISSFKKTLSERELIPVTIPGFRRVFNITSSHAQHRNILNVTHDPDCVLNAVLFSVNEEEYLKLKKREERYEEEMVSVYCFKTGKELDKATIFIDYRTDIDHDQQLPDPHYLQVCRDGARSFGADFLKRFDETTFLLSGISLKEWRSQD
ncbi:gamma-glutamylcyclotransferase [Candidatus Woesearchaeota archaeon]|nr:gamma-glutamylcyclotransferase [Candidatus Woesearchaeota archaeon]